MLSFVESRSRSPSLPETKIYAITANAKIKMKVGDSPGQAMASWFANVEWRSNDIFLPKKLFSSWIEIELHAQKGMNAASQKKWRAFVFRVTLLRFSTLISYRE